MIWHFTTEFWPNFSEIKHFYNSIVCKETALKDYVTFVLFFAAGLNQRVYVACTIPRYFFLFTPYNIYRVCFEIIKFLSAGVFISWRDQMRCVSRAHDRHSIQLSLSFYFRPRGQYNFISPRIECTRVQDIVGERAADPHWVEQRAGEARIHLVSHFFSFPPTTSAWPHSITAIAELFTCISRATWFNLKTWIHFHSVLCILVGALWQQKGEAQVNKCWARWIIVSDVRLNGSCWWG